MNVKQVKDEIRRIPEFKDFKWSIETEDSESTSAFLQVEPKNFRDSHSKDQYSLGGLYHLFVAHMYKGQKGKEFFYLILYRKGTVKPYRRRYTHEIEYNKIYASGNTVKKIMKSLKDSLKEKNYSFK